MKIKNKLNYSNFVLLFFFAIFVFVSVFLINRIQADLRQLIEVEEPLEQAILEMEINVGETARAVLHFVQDMEAHSLEPRWRHHWR